MLLGVVQATNGQFIRLNIVVPAENSIMDLSDMPADILPAETSVDVIASKTAYRWLELRSVENLEMIVSFQKDKAIYASNTDRLLYLNDGSTFFSNAMAFKGNAQTFFLKELKSKSERNNTQINTFSAWIGIPSDAKGKLTIIYP